MNRTTGIAPAATAVTELSSPNWGMVMARRQVGAGRLGLRTMLTASHGR